MYTFGDNAFGKLGLGSEEEEEMHVPQKVEGLAGVTGISAGGSHSAAWRPVR